MSDILRDAPACPKAADCGRRAYAERLRTYMAQFRMADAERQDGYVQSLLEWSTHPEDECPTPTCS
ncbi:hypothetical protein [Tropicibacter naphthalenivorans]|uniref:Uncharacterized protein n=1 Tax=Tropicibacter naphthalenivorans TaxID=441103 RepID=A0A0P1GBZ3_9RHOB|nr:hypothetical protein [Tropicibacter naphthalenivorans]CUH78870.1 hypothetical protein TRN7648_02210 [Tropicibacter naphthalenivorans]SMC82103.1 hypothetical protein SAMN04488093_104372 [Tropicibacter naphthalenivorans]